MPDDDREIDLGTADGRAMALAAIRKRAAEPPAAGADDQDAEPESILAELKKEPALWRAIKGYADGRVRGLSKQLRELQSQVDAFAAAAPAADKGPDLSTREGRREAFRLIREREAAKKGA